MSAINYGARAGMGTGAGLDAAASVHHGASVHHHFDVECVRFYHEDGSQCFHPMRGFAPPPGWRQNRVKRWLFKLFGKPYIEYCLREHTTKTIWRDTIDNLVVTAGLNKYLDATLKTGLASPAWYVGLKDTGTPQAADTMASHASWATISPYSNATDPAFTPGTISAGSVDNSASKAVFNINATDDVYGAFLKDDNTVDGATGTLLGAGDFTGGTRSVQNGDTLNVTVTASLTAA